MVKVDNDLDGIGILHEGSIFTCRYKGGVYNRGTGTRVYVGAWVQYLFPLLGFDDVNISPPE